MPNFVEIHTFSNKSIINQEKAISQRPAVSFVLVFKHIDDLWERATVRKDHHHSVVARACHHAAGARFNP